MVAANFTKPSRHKERELLECMSTPLAHISPRPFWSECKKFLQSIKQNTLNPPGRTQARLSQHTAPTCLLGGKREIAARFSFDPLPPQHTWQNLVPNDRVGSFFSSIELPGGFLYSHLSYVLLYNYFYSLVKQLPLFSFPILNYFISHFSFVCSFLSF